MSKANPKFEHIKLYYMWQQGDHSLVISIHMNDRTLRQLTKAGFIDTHKVFCQQMNKCIPDNNDIEHIDYYGKDANLIFVAIEPVIVSSGVYKPKELMEAFFNIFGIWLMEHKISFVPSEINDTAIDFKIKNQS